MGKMGILEEAAALLRWRMWYNRGITECFGLEKPSRVEPTLPQHCQGHPRPQMPHPQGFQTPPAVGIPPLPCASSCMSGWVSPSSFLWWDGGEHLALWGRDGGGEMAPGQPQVPVPPLPLGKGSQERSVCVSFPSLHHWR